MSDKKKCCKAGALCGFSCGCGIIGGVAGWCLAKVLPDSIGIPRDIGVIKEHWIELSLGLAGVGMIGASCYFYFSWCDIKKEDTEGQEVDKSTCSDNFDKENPVKKSLSPLRTGNYYTNGVWYNQRLIVEGPRAVIRGRFGNVHHTITEIGNFGKADPEIVEATGQDFYNMKLSIPDIGNSEYGVVSQDGTKITMKATEGAVDMLKDASIFELKWITQEEADALDADGDPMEAPLCPYKIQPNNLGKLVWITGQGASGKSTSAQLLSRNAGYVYYESDFFWLCINPYIPADAPEPSLGNFYQRNLIGEGLEARKKAHQKATESFHQVMDGSRDYVIEDYEDYFGLMCQDIKNERKRIGGDWVVAGTTGFKREQRDFMRSCLGPDLVFVVLSMEEEELKKRLLRRNQGGATLDEALFERMMALNKMADPVGDDEENALQVMVTDDLTKEDLTNKILQMVQQFKKED